MRQQVTFAVSNKLAGTTGLTVYDAAYLDLAIREGAQLASLDETLRRVAKNVGVSLYDIKRA